MEAIFTKKNIPKPLYKQVADWMLKNIQSGMWEPGYKLLAEEDLAKQLNVSRGTTRKAISLLIDQQLLIQIQGKGTYVENHKISYPFAQELISFSESMYARNYEFKTLVLEKKVIQPELFIRKNLNLNDSDNVLYLRRVRSINEDPAILLENWVSLKCCPGIDKEDFNKKGLFKVIEKYSNNKISYGVRNFSAVSLNKEQAVLLNLEPNTPVLCLNQFVFDKNNTPLEYSKVLLRTDKYEVTSILER